MNKKLKKMIATVSAVAMCATSFVSIGAGAEAIGVVGERLNQYTTSFFLATIDGSEGLKFRFWQAGTDFYGDESNIRVFISEPVTEINDWTGEEVTYYPTMISHTYMVGNGHGGEMPWTEIHHGCTADLYSCFDSKTGDVNEDKIPLIEKYLLENSIPYTVETIELSNRNKTTICFDHDNMTPDEIANLATEIRKAVDWSFEDMVFPTSTGIIEIIDVENTLPEPTLAGDANEDGAVNISDAVLIMQSISNPDEYQLTPQGMANADIVGDDGVTLLDALRIQEIEANL